MEINDIAIKHDDSNNTEEMNKEVVVAIERSMDMLSKYLDILNIGHIMPAGHLKKTTQELRFFTKDQTKAIEYIIAESVFGLCTLLASIFSVQLPDLNLPVLDIDLKVLDETKLIVQEALSGLLPKFKEIGILFIPVELGSISVETYTATQQKVTKLAVIDLFHSLLSVINAALSQVSDPFMDDMAIPPLKAKYDN